MELNKSRIRKRFAVVSFLFTDVNDKTFQHAISFKTINTLVGYHMGYIKIAYQFMNPRTLLGIKRIVKDGINFKIDIVDGDYYDEVVSEILNYFFFSYWMPETELNEELKWNGSIELEIQRRCARKKYNESKNFEKSYERMIILKEKIRIKELKEEEQKKKLEEKKMKDEQRKIIRAKNDEIKATRIWNKYKKLQEIY